MKGQKQLFSSVKNNKKTSKDNWRTPQWVFDFYNETYHFDIDLAADAENALCTRYYDEKMDALKQDWEGQCFLNPPYSMNAQFVNKLIKELQRNHKNETFLGVHLLVPARVCTKWFHSLRLYTEVLDLFEGRLKFINPDLKKGDKVNSAPFPSTMIYLSSDQLAYCNEIKLRSILRGKDGIVRAEQW